MRVNLTSAHGTRRRYLRGCRCSLCRAANAARQREWTRANPNRASEIAKKNYESHRDECIRRATEYIAAHQDEHRAYVRSHYRRNKERYSAYRQNRRAAVAQASGTHTGEDILSQYAAQKKRCYWCGVRLGGTYHIDHVVPLARGGSNSRENLVIACPSCNLSKRDKHPMDFAGVML